MAKKESANKILSTEEIDELLDECERRLDRCKTIYDNYFLGIEKVEPYSAKKDVQRRIIDLQQLLIRNSGQRFRFNMIAQKFGVFQTLWGRTMREIEAGTYRPHLERAARLMAKKGVAPEEVARMLGPGSRRKRLVTEAAKETQVRLEEERQKRRDAAGGVSAKMDPRLEAAMAALQGRAPRVDPAAAAGAGAAAPAAAGPAEATGEFDSMLDSLFSDGAAPFPPAPASAMPAPPPAQPPGADGAAPGIAASPPGRRPAAQTLPHGSGAFQLPEVPPPPPRPERPAAATLRPGQGVPADLSLPKVAPPPGMSETQMQALYRKYQQARRMVGQDAEGVKYEQLVQQLSRQTPGIMQQHAAAEVDFSVVVRDNRVVLKAVPKK